MFMLFFFTYCYTDNEILILPLDFLWQIDLNKMPLGQLTRPQIQSAYKVLDEIDNVRIQLISLGYYCIIFIQIFWSSSLHKLWNYLTLRFLSQATSCGLMSHSPSYVSNMDLLQYRFSELITGSNGHKLYRNVIKTSFKFWKRVCLCKIYIVFL